MTKEFYFVLLLLFFKIFTVYSDETGNIFYSGVRSSHYGIRPFPEPKEWKIAIDKMKNYFTGSVPCAIWIVGTLKDEKNCFLGFPKPPNIENHEYIVFADQDYHEQYLNFFDSVGIKIFLQVESALANNSQLIDYVDLLHRVYSQYKYHNCHHQPDILNKYPFVAEYHSPKYALQA